MLVHSLCIYSANLCNDTSIDNAASVEPTTSGLTATAYNVTCAVGYTMNGTATGSLICSADGKWQNAPSCQGK